MPFLLDDHFDRGTSNFFADYNAWEPWNVDYKLVQWMTPYWQHSKPPLTLRLPERGPEMMPGITGFVSCQNLMDREGGFLVVVDFIPRQAGITGEHFGVFLRVHNSDSPHHSERIGVAIQSSRNPSGQCEGAEAFLQLTGRLKDRTKIEYGHRFVCFKLKEDVFASGLNHRHRVEFEERPEEEGVSWEARIYRYGFWGWSLRGCEAVSEEELDIYTPSLPAGVAVALGPGFGARVDVDSIRVERLDQ